MKSKELCEQLVELAKNREGPGPDLAAVRSLGYAPAMLGELEAARSCFDQVTNEYDDAIHGNFALRTSGSHFGVGALMMNGVTYFALGYPDQAVGKSAQSVALAQTLDHPISEALAEWAKGIVHMMCRENEAALEHAGKSAKIAVEKDFPQYLSWAKAMSEAGHFENGGGEAAIRGMRQAIEDCRAIGAQLFIPYWSLLLARALGRSSQVEAGIAILDEALEDVARTEERYFEAELRRAYGQLLLESDQGMAAEAEACFQQAIKVARAQNAKSWELRAATSLAGLWHNQNKTDEARDVLAPVYDWFTEGFDTADLKDAKALLHELG